MDSVFNAQTFHILPAYVEYKLNSGQNCVARRLVRHCFDFARVDMQSGFEHALAVARYCAPTYERAVRQ